LLVITDLSRTLREEERLAWQRLLRVLGHELNNSLAPIRSMAATLAKLLAVEPLAEDWREDAGSALGVIGDRAEALARFMARYTTFARLPPPKPRRFAFAELIQRIAHLEQRMPIVVEDGVALELDADSDQIEQALINLLKNAVDATLPGTGVRVRWQKGRTELRIEIIDSGSGLPNSENLFVPFFTTKPGGSGIGLVLARQIIEAHGGSLMLENREDAKGCVARIILPL
jgi:nitrogen fixation/metabolism regulation signal transduction histidine kinase